MRTPAEAGPAPDRTAIVVFEHRDSAGLLRLLRPGFRHCFCLLRDETGWLLCDPLKTSLRLEHLPAFGNAHLLSHYARQGRRALLGRASRASTVARIGMRPLTCVEVVKRALGLDACMVVTPHQLYRLLLSTRNWMPANKLAQIP